MADKHDQRPEADSFTTAVNLHNTGVDGDKDAVKKAHKMFKKICADNPGDCLAEAYLGSATALLGRDEIEPNRRFKLALDGLKILDRAVSKEPDNIEIRILRGFVCHRLPEIYFHRLGTAIEDFTYVISRYERNKKLLKRDFYCKLLFELGIDYKQLERIEEAHLTWQKLLSVTSDPDYVELLKREGFEAGSETSGRPRFRGFRWR
ncbi:hypothetical protein [Phosphitispora fastidiosa]|uniref:hypothetical protein n=1 Tax=Phosphitispora fastidiosa TaxID=2837202 RepID=UPI001E49A946|nr:hypothetical protein [Phosphitispora fastidiosa]MBU7007092.1 tetratricopeptide (TPR) repeat protein [Phosphitispora fastidiosa]